jgi:hypothetical protein
MDLCVIPLSTVTHKVQYLSTVIDDTQLYDEAKANLYTAVQEYDQAIFDCISGGTFFHSKILTWP